MTSRSSRLTAEYLNNQRIGEENQMPSGAFHGRIATGYRYAMALCAILGVGMALLLWNLDPTAAAFFGLIGILAAVTLPTFFSYRCYMDRSILSMEYFILFFKVKKKSSGRMWHTKRSSELPMEQQPPFAFMTANGKS